MPPTPTGRRLHDAVAPSDAVLWDIERDPVLRSTIMAVAVLDRSPDWERLQRRFDRVSCELPRLRERIVGPPLGVGPPRWVVDDDFDLAYHLRRLRCPPPGDLGAVLALAEPWAAAAFDPCRPLWEMTLVEGLADGRAALVQKVHHSLTDGIGGVELALRLLDDRPDVAVDPPPEVVPRSASSTVELAWWAALERGRALAGGVRHLPGTVVRGLPEAPTVVPSVARLLRPVRAPGSRVMRRRGGSRRLLVLDLPLEDLRRSGHVAGGTLNDAFLASVVGGLARYHAQHASNLEQLRITMPINLRRPGDPEVGNRFTPARFEVPADIEDPVERMAALGRVARAWRAEPATALTDALAAALDALPAPLTTAVMGSMLRGVDVVCTNVPGLVAPAWLAGAEVLAQHAFAPPAGAALSVALMSHLDRACLGINVDATAVPDVALLDACLREGFDEVLAVGREADGGVSAGTSPR